MSNHLKKDENVGAEPVEEVENDPVQESSEMSSETTGKFSRMGSVRLPLLSDSPSYFRDLVLCAGPALMGLGIMSTCTPVLSSLMGLVVFFLASISALNSLSILLKIFSPSTYRYVLRLTGIHFLMVKWNILAKKYVAKRRLEKIFGKNSLISRMLMWVHGISEEELQFYTTVQNSLRGVTLVAIAYAAYRLVKKLKEARQMPEARGFRQFSKETTSFFTVCATLLGLNFLRDLVNIVTSGLNVIVMVVDSWKDTRSFRDEWTAFKASLSTDERIVVQLMDDLGWDEAYPDWIERFGLVTYTAFRSLTAMVKGRVNTPLKERLLFFMVSVVVVSYIYWKWGDRWKGRAPPTNVQLPVIPGRCDPVDLVPSSNPGLGSDEEIAKRVHFDNQIHYLVQHQASLDKGKGPIVDEFTPIVSSESGFVLLPKNEARKKKAHNRKGNAWDLYYDELRSRLYREREVKGRNLTEEEIKEIADEAGSYVLFQQDFIDFERDTNFNWTGYDPERDLKVARGKWKGVDYEEDMDYEKRSAVSQAKRKKKKKVVTKNESIVQGSELLPLWEYEKNITPLFNKGGDFVCNGVPLGDSLVVPAHGGDPGILHTKIAGKVDPLVYKGTTSHKDLVLYRKPSGLRSLKARAPLNEHAGLYAWNVKSTSSSDSKDVEFYHSSTTEPVNAVKGLHMASSKAGHSGAALVAHSDGKVVGIHLSGKDQGPNGFFPLTKEFLDALMCPKNPLSSSGSRPKASSQV